MGATIALAGVAAAVPASAGEELRNGSRHAAEPGQAREHAPGNELALEAAIGEALAHNPELLGVRGGLAAAQASLAKARSLVQFNPEIGGGAGHRDFDDGGSDVQAAADISIEIEVAGQRSKRIEAATHEVARVEAQIADAERTLRARVSEAFYAALHAGERNELARDAADRFGRLAAAAQSRFRAGDASKAEPNLALIRHAQARKDALVARREHESALRALARLLGRSPDVAVRVRGDLEARTVDAPDVDALVDTALQRRPDMREIELRIERIESEQALARRLTMPNVTLGAFYEEEAESGGARDRIVGAEVHVPLPLFDTGRAERATLASVRAQAEQERQAKRLEVIQDVRDAHAALIAAAEAVEIYQAGAVDRIDESSTFVERAYDAGKIGLLELLVLQNDLVEGRAGYADSLWEYRRAQSALELAVGVAPAAAGRQEQPDERANQDRGRSALCNRCPPIDARRHRVCWAARERGERRTAFCCRRRTRPKASVVRRA